MGYFIGGFPLLFHKKNQKSSHAWSKANSLHFFLDQSNPFIYTYDVWGTDLQLLCPTPKRYLHITKLYQIQFLKLASLRERVDQGKKKNQKPVGRKKALQEVKCKLEGTERKMLTHSMSHLKVAVGYSSVFCFFFFS